MQKTRFTSVLSTFIVCYVFWILLTWSLSPEELAAGAVVCFFVALFSAKYFIHENAGWLFRPDKFFALLAYFVVFLGLLIKSNLNVAKCCYKGCKDVYPGIVKIPTKLKGDYAQAMLAISITLTPGTITLDIIEENGETRLYDVQLEYAYLYQFGKGEIDAYAMTDSGGSVYNGFQYYFP